MTSTTPLSTPTIDPLVSNEFLLSLYVGTVPCSFRNVPGTYFPFHRHSFTHHKIPVGDKNQENSDAKTKDNLRVNNQVETLSISCGSTLHNSSSIQFPPILVPCIPAINYIYTHNNSTQTRTDHDSTNTQVSVILKCPATVSSESPVGITSGIRSALVRPNVIFPYASLPFPYTWIRLKGCGNGPDGFIFSPVSGTSSNTIRGCAFRPTAFREMIITHDFQHYLHTWERTFRVSSSSSSVSQSHILCGNSALGWMEYSPSTYPTTTVSASLSPCPVVPTCIVFSSLGNQRVADNILLGLETLLSHISHDFFIPCIDVVKSSSFPPARWIPNTNQVQPTWITFFDSNPDTLLSESKWSFKDSSISSVVYPWFNVNTLISTSPPPASIVEEKYHGIWVECATRINKYISSNSQSTCKFTSLLSLYTCVLSHIGYECGILLSLLHKHCKGTSWGTYRDPMGTHCNAHLNNFLLRPPPAGSSSVNSKEKYDSNAFNFFLAPLDFDMAFTRDEYIPPNTSTEDFSDFDEILQFEYRALEMAMAGDPELSSGMLRQCDYSQDSKDWNKDLIKWIGRDGMVQAFRFGYNFIKDHHNKKDQDHSHKWLCIPLEERMIMYDLLTLALLLTTKEVA